MGQEDGAGGQAISSSGRVADYLRDAVVELEVWRQNARSVEERQALHRVTALLGLAAGEVRNGGLPDPAQQSLPLTPGTAP
jgi:hypothetical protein